MSDQSTLIQQYATKPTNKHELKNTTISHAEENKICGDDITVHLYIKDDILKDWSFTGYTSIITTACSSIF